MRKMREPNRECVPRAHLPRNGGFNRSRGDRTARPWVPAEAGGGVNIEPQKGYVNAQDWVCRLHGKPGRRHPMRRYVSLVCARNVSATTIAATDSYGGPSGPALAIFARLFVCPRRLKAARLRRWRRGRAPCPASRAPRSAAWPARDTERRRRTGHVSTRRPAKHHAPAWTGPRRQSGEEPAMLRSAQSAV